MAEIPVPQQHPQWAIDRASVDQILQQPEVTDYGLVELARLRIRYQGFPGAEDIKKDLDKMLEKWKISETELFDRTRQIHASQQIYRNQNSDQEDWT
jgi:hypothetical protein